MSILIAFVARRQNPVSEKSQTIDDVHLTIAGNVSRQRASTISQFQKIKAKIKNVKKDEKRNKVCTFLMLNCRNFLQFVN